MMPTAYHRGREDYGRGVKAEDCPEEYMLADTDKLWKQWLLGWTDAAEEELGVSMEYD
jgi:hypothetical protein